MRKILVYIYNLIVLKFPDRVTILILNLFCRFRRNNVRFKRGSKGFIAYDAQLKLCINFIFINRANLYFSGILKRFDQLLEQYNIDLKSIPEKATFIDCGANIGEVGAALNHYRPDLNYIAFEPGAREFDALKLNLQSKGRLINCGLWYESTDLIFYEKGDTADSSYIEIKDFTNCLTVPVVTLDSLQLADENIYLKLEAEGAEPEVLRGAENTLDSISSIYADCGFERGIKEETTLPAVANILISNGFELKSATKDRLIIVFQRKQ